MKFVRRSGGCAVDLAGVHPMRLVGAKEELIRPIVLLGSRTGSFMTGSDLLVSKLRISYAPF